MQCRQGLVAEQGPLASGVFESRRDVFDRVGVIPSADVDPQLGQVHNPRSQPP